MTEKIPAALAPLLKLAPAWAFPTERQRQEKRATSTMAALQDLYTTLQPHILAIGAYLDSTGAKTLSGDDAALFHLALMYMEAALSVETYREPQPEDHFPRHGFVSPYDAVAQAT